MTLLDGLEFTEQHLTVTYRADVHPQLLRIHAHTAGPSAKRSGPIVVRKIMDLINAGAAAGRMFLPEESSAERVSGPWNGADAFGPHYEWQLRVTAVCPEFMRTVVELARKVGWEQPLLSLDVFGGLPPDGSPAAATTGSVRRALQSATSYVPRCRAPSFDVNEQTVGESIAKVTLQLNQRAGQGTMKVIEAVFAKWLAGTASIVGQDGRSVERSVEQLEQMIPRFERSSSAMSATLEWFPHATKPSSDMLINMLQKLNAQIHAIDAVRIS